MSKGISKREMARFERVAREVERVVNAALERQSQRQVTEVGTAVFGLENRIIREFEGK